MVCGETMFIEFSLHTLFKPFKTVGGCGLGGLELGDRQITGVDKKQTFTSGGGD